MANPYYDHTTFPVANSPGSSQAMRNELDAVEGGFDKLPTFAGNAGKIVYVNVGETALSVLSTTGTGNVVLSTDPTFTLTDVTTNNASTTAHGWMKKLSGAVTDYFRGDGNWTRLPIPTVFDRSTNTILDASNNGGLINFTAGFTQTVTAAATLANGWSALVKNSSTADVVIDPNGAETIDGATTLTLRPGDARLLASDGSNFRSIPISGNSGRVLLATMTPAGGAAAMNFLTTFSSLYDDYEILMSNIIPVTNDNLVMQLATGGTAISSSSYVTLTDSTATTTSTFIAVTPDTVIGSNGSGRGSYVSMIVQNVNSASGMCVVQFTVVNDAGVPGFAGKTRQAVCVSTSTVFSGFRLFWQLAGTFNGATGTVRVYGIRKNV